MAQLEVHRDVSGAANTPCETPKPSVDASVVRRLRRYERTSAVNPVILGELRVRILPLPSGRRKLGRRRWFDSITRGVPWISSALRPACTGPNCLRILARSEGQSRSPTV